MSEWQSVQHYTREEVQATFDWALQQHASSLNLKSRPIPAEYRDIVDKALLRIGYRFRVNKLAFETPVKAGKPLAVSVTCVMMASPRLTCSTRYNGAWSTPPAPRLPS